MKRTNKPAMQADHITLRGARPTPAEISRDTKNWKPALGRIIAEHNWKHAKKHKGVSKRTEEERSDGLYRYFTWLREAGFKFAPYNLGGRHIEFLMRYVTAAPGLEDELEERGSKLQPRTTPLEPSTIQSMLSTLRTFCQWIGKPGLVRPGTHYADEKLVERSGVAKRDRTWSGVEVDRADVIAKVTQADSVVGLQLEVMAAFGLRRKEAVMFSPALACVPAYALPEAETSTSYLAFLKVKQGTKGGRLRYVALRDDLQKDVLQRALRVAPHPGTHIGYPGKTLKQALDKFSNTLRKCGVSLKELGVTPHGARHEFASNLYIELTDALPPIKGGNPSLEPALMEAAYQEVARQLGHGRARITQAYLGRLAARRTGDSTGNVF